MQRKALCLPRWVVAFSVGVGTREPGAGAAPRRRGRRRRRRAAAAAARARGSGQSGKALRPVTLTRALVRGALVELLPMFCIRAVVQLWDDNRFTYAILIFFGGLISRELV